MIATPPPRAEKVLVDADKAGQRLDNFLVTYLKGVPRTRIYRIIRKGEVRVNQGRIKPDYRLKEGDLVRVPPVHRAPSSRASKTALLDKKPAKKAERQLLDHIIYEDEDLLVLNKPKGMAVHGGSGISLGVIEHLRALRPGKKPLELVHRLDRETSGCLLVAKGRVALRALHAQFRSQEIEKVYWVLVKGSWKGGEVVDLPLKKNQLRSGERMVRVAKDGQAAKTLFKVLKRFKEATLLEASPLTGRTHQIRVHTAKMEAPVVGDEKYGDKDFNLAMKKQGLKGLFLHAKTLSFVLPGSKKKVRFEAPLAKEFELGLKILKERG